MNLLTVNRIFLLLSILLIVVMFPRFDRADRFGIDAFTTGGERATVHRADSAHYENNVLYFRGEVD